MTHNQVLSKLLNPTFQNLAIIAWKSSIIKWYKKTNIGFAIIAGSWNFRPKSFSITYFYIWCLIYKGTSGEYCRRFCPKYTWLIKFYCSYVASFLFIEDTIVAHRASFWLKCFQSVKLYLSYVISLTIIVTICY